MRIMGPNGSGKSTLAHTLMGHPSYEATAGQVLYNGEDILEKDPNVRAKLGIFLAVPISASDPRREHPEFLAHVPKGSEAGMRLARGSFGNTCWKRWICSR